MFLTPTTSPSVSILSSRPTARTFSVTSSGDRRSGSAWPLTNTGSYRRTGASNHCQNFCHESSSRSLRPCLGMLIQRFGQARRVSSGQPRASGLLLPVEIRVNISASPAAGLAGEPALDRQPNLIRPPVAADRCPMAAVVIRAIDHETANVRGTHLGEGDLLAGWSPTSTPTCSEHGGLDDIRSRARNPVRCARRLGAASQLTTLGYSVEKIGESQRILPHAVAQRFEVSSSGALVPVTELDQAGVGSGHPRRDRDRRHVRSSRALTRQHAVPQVAVEGPPTGSGGQF
jgi:hypothetical protein